MTEPYDPDFLSFWTAYPKKVGKDDAYKAWQQRRPPLVQVLEALTKQHDWLRRDGGTYTPNPATWIRQGRYQDEPPAVPASSAPPEDDQIHAKRLLAYLEEKERRGPS